jgi:hypothetical protein
MSATYRIEVQRDPHSTILPWEAAVYRISDDQRVTVCVGLTRTEAEAAAREWVRDEEENPEGPPSQSAILYVDDHGRDAEAPQSVKV